MGVNEQLGLKSIAEFQKNSMGENVRKYVTSAWYLKNGMKK